MNNKSRIRSILQADSLDYSITGIRTFDLSELDLTTDLDILLPTNVRLGHLAESVVSELIKASSNYNVLHENVQIIEGKKTIGEIDFIIEDLTQDRLIHMELAYKFYLYDSEISSESINNWIGPNRNDSLKEKLDKLKRKQFPLLYEDCSKSTFDNIEIDEVTQSLCLLVSLFIPYGLDVNLGPVYEKAIKGYYLGFETFTGLDNSSKTYHLPSKKQWGIEPSENEVWADYSSIVKQVIASLKEKQAPLCWQKCEGSYIAFFIIWW